MHSFSDKVNQFNKSLNIQDSLPDEVHVMNPYRSEQAYKFSALFYERFFDDNKTRIGLFGINPGRFGAGVTGVPFTDPVKLEIACGIPNDFEKKTELSSDFIYLMINEYGGPAKFYARFFLTALCPLGFTRQGKNMNYYDTSALLQATEPFILTTVKKQIDLGLDRSTAICLGQGKNMDYFSKINKKYSFFKEILPLPHPRYIMQYQRKKLPDHLNHYIQVLNG